ncbi:MAG TPA: DUF5719 family protein [Streptosporangiaceae bacterium]|nr:DUF5719 family protein [Streptosporangiaceae bacterium]
MSGLVMLALAALAAVAALTRPVTLSVGRAPAPARPAVVTTGLRACATPSSTGDHGLALIAAAAAHGQGQAVVTQLPATSSSGSSSSGSSSSGSSASAPSPLYTLSQPGELSLRSVPAMSRPHGKKGSPPPAAAPAGVMIQASGSMAQGLEVEQTSGGMATLACGRPGTDFWFTGPGQQSAGSIQLYLMNTDDEPSSVAADISTDAGPLQGSVDTGITVPPHSVLVQSLAGLVHGSRSIGVHVRTSVGRVVAALWESRRPGLAGGWLPASQAPAKRLVIPGLPGVPGGRDLYIAAASGSDVQVKIAVVTPGGSYQPTGGAGIAIPAGSADRIELPSLGGVAGAAVLTSTVPVTASFAVPGGPPGAPGAFTAPVPALQEQGVVAGGGGAGEVTTLVLTAPGRAARVRVAAGATGLTGSGPAGGSGAVQTVAIPAKHSVSIKIARPARAGFALVITPLSGSGPVYAGRVLTATHGTVLSIIPVVSAPTQIPLPAVRESLLAVTP